ncbi:MAG TPA: ATP-binding protein [Rhodoferax sp.]|nr:ATP-binding protein [Rhodoferax sp.]HOF51553.1 ATP-binding protein [Rhodoferax sp.]
MTAPQPPRSLQARVLTLVVGLVTLVWLAAALFTWIDASHELDELLDGHLAQAAGLLVVQQSESEGDDDGVLDAPSLHKYAPKVAFQVFHEGILITRTTNASEQPMSDKTTGFSTRKLGDGKEWRVFGARGAERDVQVFVGERTESRNDILWAVMRGLLLPLVLALPLLAAALWWSVRAGLSPLRALSEALAQRAPQTLEPVVLDDCPEEMRPLVGALNELLERIGRMVVSERRFTADAAHELRTPIAAIRAQAQVALGAGDDVAERQHALQATLAGCDRATRLVEQLLMLARLETNPVRPALPVNLTAVVRRVAADLAPAALGRSQVLELEAEEGCAVAADEILLGVLVRNLVDNALRYSPAGARVLVVVKKGPEGVCLCVQDSGPGMAPEAIQRLGERFFRVLGTDQPGSGLGWSIVKRLVDAFGARVQIRRSEALGGLSVQVEWPT